MLIQFWETCIPSQECCNWKKFNVVWWKNRTGTNIDKLAETLVLAAMLLFFLFFPGAHGGVWQDQCSICISTFGIIWVFGFEVCLGLFREVYHIHVFQTEVGHFICSHPSSKSKFTRASELRTSLGLSKKSTKSSFGFSGRKVRQRLQLLLLTLPIISTATIDPNVSTYCVHDKITVSLGVPQNLRHYPRRSVQ